MFKRLLDHVKKFASRPAFPWLVAGVAFLDVFLFVVPEDLLLVAGAASQPRRWKRTALIVAVGSATGTFLLSLLLRAGGHALFGEGPASGWWGNASSYFERWGPWALGLAAATPIPVQPFVAVATAGGLPPAAVFAVVFGGRLVKYTGITLFVGFRGNVRKIWS